MLAFLLACSLVPTGWLSPSNARAVSEPAPVATAAPHVLPSIADRYQLGSRASHGNLHLWPVVDTGRARVTDGVVALSVALERGLVKVEEVDEGGSVPRLRVTNLGQAPVLLGAGDVVTGGKQDRVLVDNSVIPPGGQPVDVAVNCVEQGRWSASDGLAFGFGGRAEMDLKRTVAVERNQTKTWEKVREVNAEKKVKLAGEHADALSPASGTYAASLRTEAVVDAVGPYLSTLEPALGSDDRTVGYVAAVGDKLVGAEIYGNPKLFAQVRGEAVAGLAREAVGEATGGHDAPADDDARAFLADALGARETARAAQAETLSVEAEGASTKAVQLRDKAGELYKLDVYAK